MCKEVEQMVHRRVREGHVLVVLWKLWDRPKLVAPCLCRGEEATMPFERRRKTSALGGGRRRINQVGEKGKDDHTACLKVYSSLSLLVAL